MTQGESRPARSCRRLACTTGLQTLEVSGIMDSMGETIQILFIPTLVIAAVLVAYLASPLLLVPQGGATT